MNEQTSFGELIYTTGNPISLDDLLKLKGHFTEFTKKVVEALQEYVSLWCTLNEPNILATSGYLFGIFPPGKTSIRSLYKVCKNIVVAHSKAYEAIHLIQPSAQVGIAHHFRGFIPEKSRSPLDATMGHLYSANFNDIFPRVFQNGVLNFWGIRKSVPGAIKTQDYFGLNYYTRELVSFSLAKPGTFFGNSRINPIADLSPNGSVENKPETFFEALKWAKGFNLPIYITENGTEDGQMDDSFRRKYLIQHIHQLWRGVNYTWPIKGYYHWSLVDNFEWERGWSQRFGLWELDRETQARKKRPSADLYKAICHSNSLSSAMVSEYSPELIPILFPE